VFRVKITNIVDSYKSSNFRIVVSCFQEVGACFGIEVVRTVSEGVDRCNIYTIGKLGVGNCTCDNISRIVGVFGNSFCILVNDSDYVAQRILNEIVGNIIVKNTANVILVVVYGNKMLLYLLYTSILYH
jgi:hypothetical protein